MRPFQILDCIDLNPKAPTRQMPAFRFRHMLLVWLAMALFFASIFLTGCDSATTASIVAADSTARAGSSDPLLGAWRHIPVQTADSTLGWAFRQGRYTRSYPTWVAYGNEQAHLVVEFECGTWSRVGSALVLSPDSIGIVGDTTYGSRCDSFGICWGDDKIHPETVPYAVQGDTLVTYSSIYVRVRK